MQQPQEINTSFLIASSGIHFTVMSIVYGTDRNNNKSDRFPKVFKTILLFHKTAIDGYFKLQMNFPC